VEDVYSHRQLYVGLSRAICANQVKVLLSGAGTGKQGVCQNIVFTEVINDWFKLFQLSRVRKGWGLGGTPRNTSNYCFLRVSFIMIFVFLLYFREVLNDCFLNFLHLYFPFLYIHFPFYYFIMQQGLQFTLHLQSNHFRLSGDEACGIHGYALVKPYM